MAVYTWAAWKEKNTNQEQLIIFILTLYHEICFNENKRAFSPHKYAYCAMDKYNFVIFLKQSKTNSWCKQFWPLGRLFLVLKKPPRAVFVLWSINQDDLQLQTTNICRDLLSLTNYRIRIFKQMLILDSQREKWNTELETTYFLQEWQCQTLDPHLLHRDRGAGPPGEAADIHWKPWWPRWANSPEIEKYYKS